MVVRKFAAHYLLLPDGSLGKWPVVEMDNRGMVVSVAVNPQGFKEQPSLQYHGGILLPGFVDARAGSRLTPNDQRTLNRHLVHGTLVLNSTGCQVSIRNADSPPFLIQEKQGGETTDLKIVQAPSSLTIWERLLASLAQNPGVPLAMLLHEATALGADQMGLEAWFGRLSPGLFSGLLVLEHIDLHRLLPVPQTRVRWLVQPKNPLL